MNYINSWSNAHSMKNYQKMRGAVQVISDYNSDGMYTGMATKARLKAQTASQVFHF